MPPPETESVGGHYTGVRMVTGIRSGQYYFPANTLTDNVAIGCRVRASIEEGTTGNE
jgi:hypothetical protein